MTTLLERASNNDAAAADELRTETGRFLSVEDAADLTTFYHQLDDCDADGFTLPKGRLDRLIELGCVYKSGGRLWSPTAFGAWLIESDFMQHPELPLKTVEDHNNSRADALCQATVRAVEMIINTTED